MRDVEVLGVVSETPYSVYVARVLSFPAVVTFRGVFRVNAREKAYLSALKKAGKSFRSAGEIEETAIGEVETKGPCGLDLTSHARVPIKGERRYGKLC